MLLSRTLIPGGVHPVGHKQLSNNSDIVKLPNPKRLFIALKQHSGKPARPIVKPGDQVLAGQLIAVGDNPFSANIHAPLSGVVEKIAPYQAPTPGGEKQMMIHLRCDEEQNQEQVRLETSCSTQEEMIKLVAEAGIVGMGGAVFPAATKLRSALGKPIHTLLVNGCECEPYLTCDDLIMRERAADVISGIRYSLELTGANKAIIGVEDNKPQAMEALRNAASEDANIEVMSLPTHYPMGSEKQFIHASCKVEVPKGKLSADVGVIVQNVATCAAIFHALRFGRSMTHRIVTITGGAIEQPMNIEAPIGTLISELIAHCGGLKSKAERIVVGGPMMGHTITNVHTPITKGTGGILLLHEDELPKKSKSPCVRCGRCVKACPMGLLPNAMAEFVANDDLEGASKQGLSNCLLCGSCAYICPASMPLTQYFNYAKGEINRANRLEQKAKTARRLNQARTLRLEQEAAEKAAAKAAKQAARGEGRKPRASSRRGASETTTEQES